MARKRLYLCIFYALVASIALLATWSQNLSYLDGPLSLGAIADAYSRFAAESKANPAARSISVDILLLSAAAVGFMIFEARRLGIRFVWAYVALGFLLGISVTLPLFLITRERHLAWHEGPANLNDELEPVPVNDGVGIAVVSVVVICLSGFVIAG